jgi:hypothetical protein
LGAIVGAKSAVYRVSMTARALLTIRSSFNTRSRQMDPSTAAATTPGSISAYLEEADLRILQMRVSAEYREMPGLSLTLPQAARLFSIDASCCEQILGALVERGVLATSGRLFIRAGAGDRRVWSRPL